MKPQTKQRIKELLVAAAALALTLIMIGFCALTLLAALSAANAQALPLDDASFMEALTDVEACLGPVPNGTPKITYVAPDVIQDYCGVYDIQRHAIYISVDAQNTPSCGSLTELLRHELVHAYGHTHPSANEMRGTSLDDHYVAMRKCGFEGLSDSTALPARLGLTAASSSEYQKHFALSLHTHPISGFQPLIVGARLGLFNWTNIRDLEAYSPFGQLEAGLRLGSGSLYVQVTQGVGFVGTPPASIRRLGLATALQFPTTAEVGLQNGPHSLGLHLVHYSNGKTNQRGQTYDGIGLTFSTLFN